MDPVSGELTQIAGKAEASAFLNGPGDSEMIGAANALQPSAQTPHDFIPGFCGA
jgi:hypothetical protein